MTGSRAGRAFGCGSSREEKREDILWTQLPVKEIAPLAHPYVQRQRVFAARLTRLKAA